jgi:hypothetical protein
MPSIEEQYVEEMSVLENTLDLYVQEWLNVDPV